MNSRTNGYDIGAYVVDAVRTPRGKGRRDGGLARYSPIELVTTVLRAIKERSRLAPDVPEDIILGCVESVDDQGGNLGRIAGLLAGFSSSVPAMQLNRFCGSGLEAVNIAAAKRCETFCILARASINAAKGLQQTANGAWPFQPAFTGFFRDARVDQQHRNMLRLCLP